MIALDLREDPQHIILGAFEDLKERAVVEEQDVSLIRTRRGLSWISTKESSAAIPPVVSPCRLPVARAIYS